MSSHQNSLPPQNETTSSNSSHPDTDDAKTSQRDSDPNAKETPPAQTEATSKDSPPVDAPSQTSEHSETSKPGSATNPDPHMQGKTSSGDEETSSKRDSPSPEASQQDFAAGVDPHVEEITPAENQTAPKHSYLPTDDSGAQIAASRKPEIDDTEARRQHFETDPDHRSREATPVGETTSIMPPESSTNNEPKTEENDPPVNEISPADDQTTAKKIASSQLDSGIRKPEAENVQNSKRPCPPAFKKLIRKLQAIINKRSEGGSKTPTTAKRPDGKESHSKVQTTVTSPGGFKDTTTATCPDGSKDTTTAKSPDGEESPSKVQTRSLSKSIEADLGYIEVEKENLRRNNEKLEIAMGEASKNFEELKKQENEKDLGMLRKAMTKLKLQLPSKYKVDADETDPFEKLQFAFKVKQRIPEDVLKIKPQLHKNFVFQNSAEFKDFVARYKELYTEEQKLCLLCFSVFPDNAIIKKSLMVRWWVCEGFAANDNVAGGYFNELMKKGFIEPVNKNGSPSVRLCRMHPFYRSALVTLAQRVKFFNFDDSGEPTQDFSGSSQACLVGDGLISYHDLKRTVEGNGKGEGNFKVERKPKVEENGKVKENGKVEDKPKGEDKSKVEGNDLKRKVEDTGKVEDNDLKRKVADNSKVEDKPKGEDNELKRKEKEGGVEKADLIKALEETLGRVHLVFNVKETRLEFRKKWFSMMKNVNFIHLGSWRAVPHHIEVEDTEFLDTVEPMNYLKFLSLQGVANIIFLRDSISQFASLKTLDLRACHNLETIPEKIGRLKSLTHLDLSECYLLDHMPEGLCELTNLEVLKGFVVGSKKGKRSCTLDGLKQLRNLFKLCIYTGLRNFPEDEHVEALKMFPSLRKLTITWGGSAQRGAHAGGPSNSKSSGGGKAVVQEPPPKPSENSNTNSSSRRLPCTLEKLDLKCFPKSSTPKWLELDQLQKLEKLYIRGGKFSDLGQYQDVDDWNLVWPGKKHTWKVKQLRLKYLSEIEMEWRQLQELFPDLEYLEQVDCPKLTFFPCDANGVWLKK